MEAELLQKRLAREKAARKQAEDLLEAKSRELYLANQEISATAQELSRQSKQLNAVLDRTMAAIMLVDDNDRIEKVNRAGSVAFGHDIDVMLGQSVFGLFEREQREALAKIQQDCNPDQDFKTIEAIHETVGLRRDRSTFPVELAIAALDLDDRRYTVWICRDLTRRKEAEAERARLEQELRQSQKLESLGTLASGIAHEINTPVQYVSDNAHYLKGAFDDLFAVLDAYGRLAEACVQAGGFDQQVAAVRDSEQDADIEFLKGDIPNSVDQALDGIQRISKIVTAIKEFSHPGTVEKTAADINKAIETTLTVAHNEWKHVCEVKTDFDPALPEVPCLLGDFNQVLLNLIINATHAIASKEEEGLGLITVRTRRAGDAAEITVADNGCGIAEEYRRQIFDPFFTTKGVGKGTGQGLSIAYSIITQKHGGSISFTSKVGEGTTFKILLPIDRDAGMKVAV
ncbi:MAG: ATP-binding protein [Minwuiales bacterium]|nr:ATP-binding protein [Minwuiales bacterium]